MNSFTSTPVKQVKVTRFVNQSSYATASETRFKGYCHLRIALTKLGDALRLSEDVSRSVPAHEHVTYTLP